MSATLYKGFEKKGGKLVVYWWILWEDGIVDECEEVYEGQYIEYMHKYKGKYL